MWNYHAHETHDRIDRVSSLILDVQMELRDQAILNTILKENSNEAVRRKLLKRYNLYYSMWIDYSILCTFLAMIGLAISLAEWERNYQKRIGSGETTPPNNIFVLSIVAVLSLMGVGAIVIKYRMEATWRNYNNPMRFYRKILRQQVDVGLIDESAMKAKAIKRDNPWVWIAKNPLFWAEIFIMSIFPIPSNDPDSFFGLQAFIIDTINWVDNSNDGYPVGSHFY